MPDERFRKLAERIGEELAAREMKLAVAECCTGGWVAKCFTDVPGAPGWFDRGFVVCTNEAKEDMLGVSHDTLTAFGAASEQSAREMAVGTLAHSGADIALAMCGSAAEESSPTDRPAATVWVAWGLAGGRDIRTKSFRFNGDGDAVREQAVTVGLEGMIEVLRSIDNQPMAPH